MGQTERPAVPNRTVTGAPWWSEEHLQEALEEHDHDVQKLADAWGVAYKTVYKWRNRHELAGGKP